MTIRRLKQKEIWFFSYSGIFILCIIISMIVTEFSENILFKQTEETMQIAFESSIYSMENKLENQRINMWAVLESDGVSNLSNKYLHPDTSTRLELIRQIMDTIRIQYVNTEFVDYNLICFKDMDLVVGMQDGVGKEYAYKTWFSGMYESEEELQRELFSLTEMTKFVPYDDPQGRPKVAIIQKRLRNVGVASPVVAVSLIDVKKLFGSMYDDPIRKTFVFADGEQIFVSYDDGVYEDNVKSGNIIKLGGEEYVRYFAEKNGLEFVQLFNNSNYTKRLSMVRRTGYFINLLLLVFGILISYAFTKINYTPLSRVKNRLKLDFSEENEYVVIEKRIETILQDQRSIMKQLKIQDNKLYDIYNKMLLNASSKEGVRLICENLSTNFTYDNFATEKFKILNIGSLESDDDTQNASIELAAFCIVNVYRELMPQGATCDFCVMGNECCCILNFEDVSVMESLCEASKEVCEFFKKHFDMRLVYFISGNSKIEDIPEMNEQIDKLRFFYELLTDCTGFEYIHRDELVTELYDRFYGDELSSSVYSGDIAEIVRIINRFINIASDCGFTKEQYINIFENTLSDTYARLNGEKPSDGKLLEDLCERGETEELKSMFIKQYKLLAKLDSREEGDVEEKLREILEIIEENYANENLNVSYISEAMNMSISQLSRYFKNNTNDGLAEYILRYRCKAAAEIIRKNPDMTVAEVGKRCGYYNAASFIRAFKSVYGVTPGKYGRQ